MLKRLLPLASSGIIFLTAASTAFAQVNVGIKPPAQGINPSTSVGTILSNALTIIFIIAALTVLFFLIIGAFNWITSGGDKDKVGKARGTIVNALVGLAILALAFLIITVVGQIIHINPLDLRFLPSLDTTCPDGQVFDPNSATTTTGNPGCVPIRK